MRELTSIWRNINKVQRLERTSFAIGKNFLCDWKEHPLHLERKSIRQTYGVMLMQWFHIKNEDCDLLLIATYLLLSCLLKRFLSNTSKGWIHHSVFGPLIFLPRAMPWAFWTITISSDLYSRHQTLFLNRPCFRSGTTFQYLPKNNYACRDRQCYDHW